MKSEKLGQIIVVSPGLAAVFPRQNPSIPVSDFGKRCLEKLRAGTWTGVPDPHLPEDGGETKDTPADPPACDLILAHPMAPGEESQPVEFSFMRSPGLGDAETKREIFRSQDGSLPTAILMMRGKRPIEVRGMSDAQWNALGGLQIGLTRIMEEAPADPLSTNGDNSGIQAKTAADIRVETADIRAANETFAWKFVAAQEKARLRQELSQAQARILELESELAEERAMTRALRQTLAMEARQGQPTLAIASRLEDAIAKADEILLAVKGLY